MAEKHVAPGTPEYDTGVMDMDLSGIMLHRMAATDAGMEPKIPKVAPGNAYTIRVAGTAEQAQSYLARLAELKAIDNQWREKGI